MYLLAFPQFFLKVERSDLFKDYTSHEVKLLYLNELCHSLSRERKTSRLHTAYGSSHIPDDAGHAVQCKSISGGLITVCGIDGIDCLRDRAGVPMAR